MSRAKCSIVGVILESIGDVPLKHFVISLFATVLVQVSLLVSLHMYTSEFGWMDDEDVIMQYHLYTSIAAIIVSVMVVAAKLASLAIERYLYRLGDQGSGAVCDKEELLGESLSLSDFGFALTFTLMFVISIHEVLIASHIASKTGLPFIIVSMTSMPGICISSLALVILLIWILGVSEMKGAHGTNA